MKLIVFPHAGGFSGYYNFMKNNKFDSIDEVYIFEYPGRGLKSDMPFVKSIQQVAKLAALEVGNIIGEDNYILFGHSMGAFVMYETMLILQKKLGKKAFCVISSGQKAPFGYDGIGFDASSNDTVIQYIKDMGGTNDILIQNEEARNFFIPIIQNDLIVASTYNATDIDESERCENIAVVYGEDDTGITDENTKEWCRVGEHYLGRKIFRGGHFYMNECSKELTSYIEEVVKNVLCLNV